MIQHLNTDFNTSHQREIPEVLIVEVLKTGLMKSISRLKPSRLFGGFNTSEVIQEKRRVEVLKTVSGLSVQGIQYCYTGFQHLNTSTPHVFSLVGGVEAKFEVLKEE